LADTLSTFIRVVLLALAALLPIINPVGLAPIFLSLTPGASDPLRTTLAVRVARNSFVLLVGAMLTGSYVLILFGLSLSVVKIAGGLLVISTAWHLIRAEQPPDAVSLPPSAATRAEPGPGYSYYPLTFPITIGPGTLSVALTLGAGVPIRDVGDLPPVLGAVTGILLVCFTVYLSYRFASRLLRVMGGTGTIVVLRLSAFILLSIGVQILCEGLAERFTGLVRALN
jgi:multiple antibiotic resistance protein